MNGAWSMKGMDSIIQKGTWNISLVWNGIPKVRAKTYIQ